MQTIKNSVEKLGKAAFVTVAIKVASFIKASYILGSSLAFFSGVAIVAPLAGVVGGVSGSFLVCAFRIVFHALLFGSVSFHYLAYCLPGLVGSLYFATPHRSIRLLVPLSMMVLFIAHPVGSAAWLYAMYWLIPVALYFLNNDSLFAQAVGSTFVAHGVGSVIFLYTTPMTAAMWLSLIPIVAVERLTFALAMVAIHQAYVCVVAGSRALQRHSAVAVTKRCA